MGKRMRCLVVVGCLFAAMVSHGVQAAIISVDPGTDIASVGDILSVEVNVSGLGASGQPSLSVFDLDLAFDSAVLSFRDAVFGPYLGDTDPFSLETEIALSVGTGAISLYELSFLDANAGSCVFCIPPYLDDLQSDAFVLADVAFEVIGVGSSPLTLGVNTFGDTQGVAIPATTVNGAVEGVLPSGAAPAPAPTALMVLAAVVLGAVRRARAGSGADGRGGSGRSYWDLARRCLGPTRARPSADVIQRGGR
jgi:hypothetical protein